jgi:hypothetical protein
MRTRSLLHKLFRLIPIALVIVGPWFHATPARADSTSLSFHVIFSDFDGDDRLDQAHLFSHGSHKQIQIHLQQSSSKTLSFDAGVSDPGNLVSSDIDQDGNADLVWLSQTTSIKIVFWMGDGHGNFTSITDPALESQLVKEVLDGSADWKPTHAPVDNELDGLVSDDGVDAPQTSTGWIPEFASSRRSTNLHSVSTVSSPFLSVLQKRGPPPLARR